MRLRDKKKSNSLEELGYKLYSDSDSFRVYKYENESLVITIFIGIGLKTLFLKV